jgi:hypothetical protein
LSPSGLIEMIALLVIEYVGRAEGRDRIFLIL